jgi:AcrR family transcriptional regulator
MDNVNSTNTEDKILAAAEEEFIEKGKAGARMQHIADRAGINKSLLHYYYRSKDKLFEMIFETAFKIIIPKVNEILNGDLTVEEKIRKFTFEYISLIQKKPNIPVFIINELNSGASVLSKLVTKIDINLSDFEAQLQDEINKGNYIQISVPQLVLNMVSLSVFPVVAKPVAIAILFKNQKYDYEEMIEKRKTEVADFIINAIKLK